MSAPAVPPSQGDPSGSKGRQTRAIRGVAAATVATLVSATAHTLAGGGAPPAIFVAVVILLASPLCVALAGRTLALWRLALSVLASQALFHVAFAVTSGAGAGTTAGHSHHEAAQVAAPASAVAWSMGPLMLLSHGIAALLTVVALLHGERMLRAVARGILRLLRPRFETARASFPTPRALRREAARSIPSPFFTSELSRRGPPLDAQVR